MAQGSQVVMTSPMPVMMQVHPRAPQRASRGPARSGGHVLEEATQRGCPILRSKNPTEVQQKSDKRPPVCDRTPIGESDRSDRDNVHVCFVRQLIRRMTSLCWVSYRPLKCVDLSQTLYTYIYINMCASVAIKDQGLGKALHIRYSRA